MGMVVPADDLPAGGGGMAVPAGDLPGAPAAYKPQPLEPASGEPLIDPKDLVRTPFLPANALVAVGKGPAEAALSIGSGMVATPISGLAGLAGAVLPGETGQGARWAANVQNALTYQPRTKVGQQITDIAALPGRAVHAVAEGVGERGAEVSPTLGTIGQSSVEILPALLGARSAMAPKNTLTPKQTAATQARDAGFTLTPEEMGAGHVARNAASIAGEPRLARGISNKNQQVMLEKLGADLNIPRGTVIDLDTIKGVLQREHKAYENVRGTGTVQASPKFGADLDALNAKYANISRDFPELAPKDVQSVINGARRPVFTAEGAVDLINQLRQSATDAFASRQSGLGKVYRGVADAVEAELGRHVQSIGRPELAQQFASARSQIAKAHMLEDALLSPDTINPKVYAAAAREGKPITGGASQVGEFASRNERSAMKPSSIGTGATLADIGAALLAGLRSSGGSMLLDAATVGARPVLRAALSSRPGQWLTDPRTNISSPTMQAMGVGSLPRPQEETQ